MSNIGGILLITLGSAGATSLGGAIAIWKKPSDRGIGELQSIAAGIMLALSIWDLVPETTHQVGAIAAFTSFLFGVAIIYGISRFFPHREDHDHSHSLQHDSGDELESGVPSSSKFGQELIHRHTPSPSIHVRMSDVKDDEFIKKSAKLMASKSRRAVTASAMITFLGMTLHNIPEGMAVALTAVNGISHMWSVGLAIALHNIPEGIAVAAPVYSSTGRPFYAFALASISGLAELVGALLILYFGKHFVSDYVVNCLLASVAGIMCYLSLVELLPEGRRQAGRNRSAIWCTLSFIAMVGAFVVIKRLVPV